MVKIVMAKGTIFRTNIYRHIVIGRFVLEECSADRFDEYRSDSLVHDRVWGHRSSGCNNPRGFSAQFSLGRIELTFTRCLPARCDAPRYADIASRNFRHDAAERRVESPATRSRETSDESFTCSPQFTLQPASNCRTRRQQGHRRSPVLL